MNRDVPRTNLPSPLLDPTLTATDLEAGPHDFSPPALNRPPASLRLGATFLDSPLPPQSPEPPSLRFELAFLAFRGALAVLRGSREALRRRFAVFRACLVVLRRGLAVERWHL